LRAGSRGRRRAPGETIPHRDCRRSKAVWEIRAESQGVAQAGEDYRPYQRRGL